MSKISKEGYNQIQVIKNALNSMYDKLSNANLYSKDESRSKNEITTFQDLIIRADKEREIELKYDLSLIHISEPTRPY